MFIVDISSFNKLGILSCGNTSRGGHIPNLPDKTCSHHQEWKWDSCYFSGSWNCYRDSTERKWSVTSIIFISAFCLNTPLSYLHNYWSGWAWKPWESLAGSDMRLSHGSISVWKSSSGRNLFKCAWRARKSKKYIKNYFGYLALIS